jgi:molybdopterin-guanine dinucleotide biosynthesis protein A
MPQMTAAHIRQLWSRAEAGRGVVPVNENWFEPLCAIYPAEGCGLARDLLAQRELSLQNFARNLVQFNQIKRYEIPESERNLYLNLNEWGPGRA